MYNNNANRKKNLGFSLTGDLRFLENNSAFYVLLRKWSIFAP